MLPTTTPTQLSQTEQVQVAINKAIADLQGTTNESAIKAITTECWLSLEALVPNENTFRKTRKQFRNAIEKTFPNSQEPKPGYYFTSTGKGKGDRYEHLALWYASTNKKHWDVVGDEARANYFKNLPSFENAQSEIQSEPQPEPQPESQPEIQLEPQLEPQPEIKVLELQDMTIESLKLDFETQQVVEDAIVQSGMSLVQFVQQACKVYAKTVTGKSRKHSEDLSVIETETLRKDKAYSTHPGRAEELVRRAIQVIKYHNGQSTELNQKWLITQSLLADMTGAKASAVKSAMSNYQTDIDSHNKALTDAGATSLLNRKGELKEDFCDEWVTRVSFGID